MSIFSKLFFLFALCSFVACSEPDGNSNSSADTSTSQTKAQKPKTKKNKPSAANKSYYTSSSFGFKILHPAGWEVLKNQSANVPVAFINRAAGSNSNGAETISVAVEKVSNVTLEDYYEFSRDQLVNIGQVEEIIEETSGTSPNGYPFKRIIFNRKVNMKATTSVSFLYYHNNAAYTVTCGGLVQNFNKMRAFFEETGMSLTFL